MQAYVKPTLEVIELKPEERLASCSQSMFEGKNLLTIIILRLLGCKSKCRMVNVCSTEGS